MKRNARFLDFLVNPPGNWNGIIALLGIGLIGSLLTNILPLTKIWQIILAILSILFFIWGAFAVWRRSKPANLVPPSQQPPKADGLVLLVGIGRPGEEPMDQSATDAINYHISSPGKPGLRVCWLIASSGETGSLPVAQKLKETDCRKNNIKAIIHAVDAFDVQHTHDLVLKIIQEEFVKEGLTDQQVIFDFTGGTKLMSAGMILACGEKYPMQYMYGRKKGIASVPRLVEFRYH